MKIKVTFLTNFYNNIYKHQILYKFVPHQQEFDRVLQFYNFVDGDFRAIIKSRNGNHVYASQISDDIAWCACIGFRVRQYCNHLDLLLQYITNVKHGERITMSNTLIETSLKGLNKISGGLPIGLPIGFYGKPQSGKSTIAIWALMDVMKQTSKNGLILDAEKGLAEHVLPNLVNRFNSLNKTNIGIIHKKIDYRTWLRNPSSIVPYKTLTTWNENEKNQNLMLVVIDIGNVKEMLLMVGKPHKVQIDGKKPSMIGEHFDLFPNSWDTPIARELDDPNSTDEFCGIIIDSLTQLMKEFGTNNQAFPVRDTAQSIILNQLTEIINTLDGLIGIIILHASRPPQDSTKEEIPVGGKAIGHGLKYSLRFSAKQREGLNTPIIIIPYRLPTELGNQTGDLITINDKGVF